MAKIGLTMITRDEESTIRECLESVAPHVDVLVVVDTGSTDSTVDIAREFTEHVYAFEWVDDFSAARQFALDKMPDDCDWIVWVDADDVVEDAEKWRLLADTAPPHVDGFVFPYQYQFDAQTGKCITRLYRERLLRGPRDRWRWEGQVHEVIVPSDGRQPQFMISDACTYVHRRPASKNVPERNLRIIQKYIAECDSRGTDPDPRMVVYLGSELMAHRRWAEAINAFHRYLEISKWDEERYQAHHKLADCYRALKMYEDAIITELKALSIRDDWADSYYGLAECYYHLKDWDRVLRWTARGDELGHPKTLLITHPLDYDFLPKVYKSVAQFNKGQIEEALETTRAALQVVPHDKNLIHNEQVFQEVLRNSTTVKAALDLASELVVHDEPLKAWEVLKNLPYTLQNDPRILEARRKTKAMIPTAFSESSYDEFYQHNPFTPLPIEEQESLVQNIPRFRLLLEAANAKGPGQRILDIGCNDGTLAVELARHGHTVVGLDLNPEGVTHCQDRAQHYQVAENTEFLRSTVEDYDGGEFDIVYSFEVIEHVPDVEAFLGAACSKLREGGLLAISTPDGVVDRAGREALGLAPREHLRVLPRPMLADLLDEHCGVVVASETTDDGLAYVAAEKTDLTDRPGRHVTIWCPFSYEAWGPDSLADGIGGSEEAVVHMARELRQLGHRVTVYGGVEGVWDGVLYHNYTAFDPYQERDVVVVWRTPTVVDFQLPANEVYIWMHDVPVAAEFTAERLERIDKVWVLSEWHRQCLPHVPDDKIQVIRNGVTPLPAVTEPRNKLKVVWGSSPDRGLDKLLAVWGDVLEAVPDAELHCFYGFDMYDKMNRPPEFKRHVMGLVEKYQDSVYWHGRVGQEELWYHFSTAGVWAYPTYFDEISCITAMRAQITGAWPVVVPRAALAETVRWGTKVECDIQTDEGLAQYRDALIQELTNPVDDEVRDNMMSDSLSYFDWAAVAKVWSDLFQEER